MAPWLYHEAFRTFFLPAITVSGYADLTPEFATFGCVGLMAFALCVVGDAKIGSPIYGVLLSCAGGVLDPLLFFILFSVTLFLFLSPATRANELVFRLRFANLLSTYLAFH